MLLEKSQQLIDLSQKKIALQHYANNLQAFQSRQKQISDAVAAIQPLIEAVRAFRQKGIADFDLTQKADNILTFIVSTEENFRQNRDLILDNTNFNGNIFKSGIERLKKTLEQQLCQAWQRYLAQNMPSTNNEMLALLARVETFKQTVQQIRILDGEIKQVIFPKNSDEFEIFEQRIAQLKQCWGSLSSDDVPEAVLHFLRAAANQGASLSLLTPEVQDWITRHGISDSLKIRLT